MSVAEHWCPIPGWEGIYEVSDLGRVRSLDRLVVYANGKRRHYRGQVLRPSAGTKGRRTVTLRNRDKSKSMFVYRLVMLAFVGPRPIGTEVCHGDGDCRNDALSNLRYDTSSANHRDKVRHGTHPEARKTCCPRRHRLVTPNLRASGVARGKRICKACDRARADVSRARRAGRPHDFHASADEHYARIMAA